MLIREVDEVGLNRPMGNALPYNEAEPGGLMLIAVAEAVEQGTGEEHLDFTLESRWTDIKCSNHSSGGLRSGRASSGVGITGRLSTIQS